ncbi:MAG: FAD-binding protein [Bifidobacteriaceae bacterium]|nr:FAD-binding protein [Bifidobacteriaceae bacterium]
MEHRIDLPLASPTVRPDAALAELTTVRIGGRPGQLVDCFSEADLVAAVRQTDSRGGPLLVIGGGSNLLAGEDLNALTVVRDRRGGARAEEREGRVLVTVEAGASWDALVEWTVGRGWAGLAALSGIPGSVGAAPVQNIGAYGAEVGQSIRSVRVFDRRSGALVELDAAALGFAYRDSALKRSLSGAAFPTPRWVVLDVSFALAAHPHPGVPGSDQAAESRSDRGVTAAGGHDQEADGSACGPAAVLELGGTVGSAGSGSQSGATATVGHDQLAEALGLAVGETAALTDIRRAVLAIRRGKGMVLDQSDHDTWSAGSFFTNPLVSEEIAAELPPDAPRFAAAGDLVKLSAAWLISRSGVERGQGMRPGARATASCKHVLALTNRGGATYADVMELADWIAARVADRFGVRLTAEPVLIPAAV